LISPVEFSTALERKLTCSKSKLNIQVVTHSLYESNGDATSK
jgi:hypothetical protein